MEIHHWISDHGFDLLEAIGIIASLTFTAVGFLRDAKSRQIENLLTLTAGHRDLWKELLGNPGMKRVLDPHADLGREPVTQEEAVFVILVIQHLHSAFQTMKTQSTINPQGLKLDVSRFLSLPIPKDLWERIRDTQNKDFVQFVENLRG